jgi:two-component system chemotaxis response regulator CheB
MPDRIRVLIVDDSRLFRSAVEQALSGHPDIQVVGSVFNGEKALDFIRNSPPDVVTLDVEMPGLDGVSTLEQIEVFNAGRSHGQHVGVIMLSALTRRGAEVTIRALEAGAFDFVTKPSGPSPEANLAALRDSLLSRIRACARTHIQGRVVSGVPPPPTPAIPTSRGARQRAPVSIIAIGASTGGPRALATVLSDLCPKVSVPIMVVQHMPPNFTQSLAESLARQTRHSVVEAGDGMNLRTARVFIAPGGRHMVLRGPAAAPTIGLSDAPPENGCRPSADVLFRSVAATYGAGVLAIILTGMGNDGTVGLGAIRRGGGYVIAQDEASSVVWGMPGSAVQAGVIDEIRSLTQIGDAAAMVATRKPAK